MANQKSRKSAVADVGTMWTMKRSGHTARCALFTVGEEWELRVLIDGEPLTVKRCAQPRKALDIAEHWKSRMAVKGWSQVRPAFPLQVA